MDEDNFFAIDPFDRIWDILGTIIGLIIIYIIVMTALTSLGIIKEPKANKASPKVNDYNHQNRADFENEVQEDMERNMDTPIGY